MAKRDESAFSKQKHRVDRLFRSAQRPDVRTEETRPAPGLFRTALEALPQRELTGRWLQAVLPDAEMAVQSLLDNTLRGGRWSPPRTFPVMYAAEDDLLSRADMKRWLYGGDGSRFIVVCIEVHLGRVLDLCDSAVRLALGTTNEELTESTDMEVSRAIGVAAYRADYQAILYPRPSRPKHRNLAIFPERVGEMDLYFADPPL